MNPVNAKANILKPLPNDDRDDDDEDDEDELFTSLGPCFACCCCWLTLEVDRGRCSLTIDQPFVYEICTLITESIRK